MLIRRKARRASALDADVLQLYDCILQGDTRRDRVAQGLGLLENLLDHVVGKFTFVDGHWLLEFTSRSILTALS